MQFWYAWHRSTHLLSLQNFCVVDSNQSHIRAVKRRAPHLIYRFFCPLLCKLYTPESEWPLSYCSGKNHEDLVSLFYLHGPLLCLCWCKTERKKKELSLLPPPSPTLAAFLATTIRIHIFTRERKLIKKKSHQTKIKSKTKQQE